MSFFANGLDVLGGTIRIPWTGVWTAELQVDGDLPVPSGPVVVVSADAATTLVGVADPDLSGTFGQNKALRIIGGRGGWQKKVSAQHFHSPIGVPLALVVAATGAEVLEVATVLEPAFFEADYVRAEGPASQVLEGRSWWVGLDGLTTVGPRIPKPQSLDVEVLDYDPGTGVATATSDGIIEPGTLLVDDRFGAKLVREVEVEIGKTLRSTLVLVDDPTTDPRPLRIVDELAHLARAAVRPEWMRLYEYRVIFQADSESAELQSVDGTAPVPDLLPCPVWLGTAGAKTKMQPGSRVLVAFISGDPSKPVVVSFQPPGDGVGWMPLELELDAATSITIGTLAPAISIGGPAALPLVLAPGLQAAFTAASTTASGAGPSVSGAALAAIFTSLASAIAGASTVKAKAL